jgi:transcriptional regulator GlxA family with amidase domain
MTAKTENQPLSVSLLALPETTPAALYGLYEVFACVGVIWPELTGEPIGESRFVPRIVAPKRKTFQCALGVPIAPHAAIDDVARTDIVIVTDVSLGVVGDPRGRWPEAAAWLRAQFEGGAIVCSICTGSILLAEAGLLDGAEATTHWSAIDLFRTCYPRVIIRPERILSPSGPEHRVITGGGASSWEELALYLIARFCGEAEAVRIAKVFVFGDRSDGQMLFAARARPRRSDDAVISRCLAWIADHYQADNPVARMAKQSSLPERTFNRRFKAATGYAPVEYVQLLRLEEAKQLLETTGEPTDSIAQAVGYEDPAFFRRLFKRQTGVTPARYRQRFQPIAKAAASNGWRKSN